MEPASIEQLKVEYARIKSANDADGEPTCTFERFVEKDRQSFTDAVLLNAEGEKWLTDGPAPAPAFAVPKPSRSE